ADLKNRGSTGSEIYYFVLNNASTDARTLNQVTNFPGDSNNPAACLKANIIAFDTLATINGLPGTARQVVLWDRVTRRFVELTRGTATSTNPAIDHLGRPVVFQSAADLKAGGGLGIGTQIFLYDLGPGLPPCDFVRCFPDPNRLTQVTKGAGISENANLSYDGRFVFFDSDAPVLGTSNGYKQIYVYDRGDGGRITQLTNGVGDSVHPTADETGAFITFASRADLLGNGSTGSSQIFYLDRERNV